MKKVTTFEEAFANYVANKPAIKPPPRPFGALMRDSTIHTLMRGNREDLERHQDALAKEAILNVATERVAREKNYPARIMKKLVHMKNDVDTSAILLQANRQQANELKVEEKKAEEENKRQVLKQKRTREAAKQASVQKFPIFSETDLDSKVSQPPFTDESPMPKRQKRQKQAPASEDADESGNQSASEEEPDGEAPNSRDEQARLNKQSKARKAEAELGLPISPHLQYEIRGHRQRYVNLYKRAKSVMPVDFRPERGFDAYKIPPRKKKTA